jgi:hypothetical protein
VDARAAPERQVTPRLRWVLRAFAALALIAGVLLFVLSEQTDRTFSWTIAPPLTAAFLGAAYWAACVLIGWSAEQRAWARARPALVPVALIATLLLIATLIHVDRFHTDDVFGWFWISVYAVIPVVLLALVVDQLRAPGVDRVRGPALPSALRAVLVMQALVMVGIGGALYIAPSSADSLWPWMLTPLTAIALGAFIVGFGVAGIHAAAENDADRVGGAALAYALLGTLQIVALARYSDTPGDTSGLIYAAFLVTVVLVGLAGVVIAQRAGALLPRA